MKLGSQRFISPITLWLGNQGLIRSGSQTRIGGPQVGLSEHKVGREALANYISPITLWLGNRGLIRSGSQTPAGAPQARLSLPGVVRERLARFIPPIALCLGTRVSWLLTPDAGICFQWSLGVPSSHLFHQPHFGYEQESHRL